MDELGLLRAGGGGGRSPAHHHPTPPPNLRFSNANGFEWDPQISHNNNKHETSAAVAVAFKSAVPEGETACENSPNSQTSKSKTPKTRRVLSLLTSQHPRH